MGKIPIGTRSLLFGCHQFLIHPIFTYLGWRYLYGTPPGYMLIVFLCHDWGYWGMREVDGEEDNHSFRSGTLYKRMAGDKWVGYVWSQIVYHSRFYAGKKGKKPSRLCWADKVGTALMPSWLWAILAHLSGEGYVYIGNIKYEMVQEARKLENIPPPTISGLRVFHQMYIRWAEQNVKEWKRCTN